MRKLLIRLLLVAALVASMAPAGLANGEPDAAPLLGGLEAEGGFRISSLLRGLVGIATLLGIAWSLSLDRRRFPFRLVGSALLLQFLLGLLLLRFDIGYGFFEAIGNGVTRLMQFSREGASFVFGSFVSDPELNGPGIAFTALPTIIFFSCLMAVLYHLRVMHVLIWIMAQLMNRTMRVTGAEAMAMAANVFVGQTEAPLVVRRFLGGMTRSETMSLMTGGFATIAGSVLAAYVGFLETSGGSGLVPHLLIASVMSAPAAFAISKVIVPETETSETGEGMTLEFKPTADNVLDAAAQGTSEGLRLWLNVSAMLLAFIAMVALIDWPLGALADGLAARMAAATGLPGDLDLSIADILGALLAPLAWLMGVDWSDASGFGALLGIKVCINEFVAFIELGNEVSSSAAGERGSMSPKTLLMATYALCGFANFSSIGIQIGGIAPLVPERRGRIISLALRAMIGGALASWMTAVIAGMFH